MPDATYQALYNEAKKSDGGVLSVCEALIYFRHPIEAPQQDVAANAPINAPVASVEHAPANGGNVHAE